MRRPARVSNHPPEVDSARPSHPAKIWSRAPDEESTFRKEGPKRTIHIGLEHIGCSVSLVVINIRSLIKTEPDTRTEHVVSFNDRWKL